MRGKGRLSAGKKSVPARVQVSRVVVRASCVLSELLAVYCCLACISRRPSVLLLVCAVLPVVAIVEQPSEQTAGGDHTANNNAKDQQRKWRRRHTQTPPHTRPTVRRWGRKVHWSRSTRRPRPRTFWAQKIVEFEKILSHERREKNLDLRVRCTLVAQSKVPSSDPTGLRVWPYRWRVVSGPLHCK